MRNCIPFAAVLSLVGSAIASSQSFIPVDSVTFLNKNSVDALGDPDNAVDFWSPAGPGGSVSAIRVTGQLTEINTGTFANEAKVRISPIAPQAFPAFTLTASGLGNYVGTIPVGPATGTLPAFTLANGPSVRFEWFESFQDDANLPEQRWDNVTYEFGNAGPVVNGNFALGSLTPNGVTVSSAGSHVSGGLDYYTLTLPYSVNWPTSYLNISMVGGASPSMSDTEVALYDGLGNLVDASDDDGPGLFSELSYGPGDPLASPDLAAGFHGATLPAGTYTIVTGGFDTVFGATINAITPGTNSGSYALNVTYLPEPSALALLALGGVAIFRRR